jgi:hypothetical protein
MSSNEPKQAQTKQSRRKKKRRKGMCLEDRPILENNAAGIDIGAREMFVAVPPDRDAHPVQIFDSFTEDLHRLADWLVACGITTVAMESTGVYWIPLYDILEARGLKPCLVNARHIRTCPGGAPIGMNVSGYNTYIRWDCCAGPSGRKPTSGPSES